MEEEVLKQEIRDQIYLIAENVLDYCEIAVPNSDRYKKLRAKILRITNDSIRNLHRFVDTNGKEKEYSHRPSDMFIPPPVTRRRNG